MKSIDELILLFRQHGLKITPQRRVIFKLLAEDQSHPSAEDIYQRVVSILPEATRATVYNTLRELVALGEINEVANLGGGGIRYNTNSAHHHHLFCMHCHTLIDIAHDFTALELLPHETAGYRIMKSQVT